jgi:hypothetical protein
MYGNARVYHPLLDARLLPFLYSLKYLQALKFCKIIWNKFNPVKACF